MRVTLRQAVALRTRAARRERETLPRVERAAARLRPTKPRRTARGTARAIRAADATRLRARSHGRAARLRRAPLTARADPRPRPRARARRTDALRAARENPTRGARAPASTES